MASEYGTQMMNAMRAVIDMHEDCIRLFRDLDKKLQEYRSIYEDTVAFDLSPSIKGRRYVAEGLVRCYDKRECPHCVLGLNICLLNPQDAAFTEPVLVVANIRYTLDEVTQTERGKRPWDPWDAFFRWAPKRVYAEPIYLDHPPMRSSIQQLTIAAKPLTDIGSLQAALDMITLTGKP